MVSVVVGISLGPDRKTNWTKIEPLAVEKQEVRGLSGSSSRGRVNE
jgi:hypothetical protein